MIVTGIPVDSVTQPDAGHIRIYSESALHFLTSLRLTVPPVTLGYLLPATTMQGATLLKIDACAGQTRGSSPSYSYEGTKLRTNHLRSYREQRILSIPHLCRAQRRPNEELWCLGGEGVPGVSTVSDGSSILNLNLTNDHHPRSSPCTCHPRSLMLLRLVASISE